MVREVNRAEVKREEVLSDRVYRYDKEKHQIRQEPDSIPVSYTHLDVYKRQTLH